MDKNELYGHFTDTIDDLEEDTERLVQSGEIAYDLSLHMSIVSRSSNLFKEIVDSDLSVEEKNSLLILLEGIPLSRIS